MNDFHAVNVKLDKPKKGNHEVCPIVKKQQKILLSKANAEKLAGNGKPLNPQKKKRNMKRKFYNIDFVVILVIDSETLIDMKSPSSESKWADPLCYTLVDDCEQVTL